MLQVLMELESVVEIMKPEEPLQFRTEMWTPQVRKEPESVVDNTKNRKEAFRHRKREKRDRAERQ